MRKKQREVIVPFNGPLSRRQRARAKEAILWLLGRRSHSVEELGEHLGLSPELVGQLVDELAGAGRLVEMEGGRLSPLDPLSRWWESGRGGKRPPAPASRFGFEH